MEKGQPLLFEVNFGGQFVQLAGKTYVGKVDYFESFRNLSYEDLVNVLQRKFKYKHDDEVYHNPTFEKPDVGLYKITSNAALTCEINKVSDGCVMKLFVLGPHGTPHVLGPDNDENWPCLDGPVNVEGGQCLKEPAFGQVEQLSQSGNAESSGCYRIGGEKIQLAVTDLIASYDLPSDEASDADYNPDDGEDIDEGSDVEFWEEASRQAAETEQECSQRTTRRGICNSRGEADGRKESTVEQQFNLLDDELAYASDNITTPACSDEEEEEGRRRAYPQYNEPWGHDAPTLELGLEFPSIEAVKQAIIEHSIANAYEFDWAFNQPKKVQAVCKKKCGWKIYASQVSGESTFQIKTFHPTHSCGQVPHKTKRINSRWISKKYQGKIIEQPNLKVSYVQTELVELYGFDVNMYAIQRGKKKIKDSLYGINVEQFESLWSYADTVLLHNRGSTIKIQVDLTINNLRPRFERMYLCFQACKNGFRDGCRAFFGLDGCHLKGEDGGQLLSAIGRDPNNGMFPIAIAWVEAETRESWTWFLSWLVKDIGVRSNGGGWTIMSDRQKGLIRAIEDILPDAEHRACVRHIYSNMVTRGFRGLEIKELLWAAASVYDNFKHTRAMDVLHQKHPQAHAYLDAIPRRAWARCYFPTFCKMDLLVNNINESFNSRILDARDKPVITTFEIIRTKLMREFQLKREAITKYEGLICPRILKKFEKSKKNVRWCRAIYAGDHQFQVQLLNRTFITNTVDRHCSCGEWQLTGLPCVHAIAAIYNDNGVPENYIDECYSVAAFKRAYQGVIYPIPSQEDWVPSSALPISPPVRRTQPGRPKTKRNRDVLDPLPNKVRRVTRMTCSICRKQGHNQRACPTRNSSSSQVPSQSSNAPFSGQFPSQQITTQDTNQPEHGQVANQPLLVQMSSGERVTTDMQPSARSSKLPIRRTKSASHSQSVVIGQESIDRAEPREVGLDEPPLQNASIAEVRQMDGASLHK